MKRTIKFRGKNRTTGEWVYGYYYVEAIDNEGHFDHCSFIKQIYGDHYKDFKVDPKTVGQFTGLLDKKKVEIYDGDLIECDGMSYEVFWDISKCCFAVETDAKEECNRKESDGYFQLTEDDLEFLEVIGNIFDDKNLIKQQNL